MGGQGAPLTGMREVGRQASVSGFGPIVNPADVPRRGPRLVEERKPDQPILIDQGTADDFLTGQLLSERFVDACARADVPAAVRFRAAYDRSNYFISRLIGDRLRFHAEHLEG
jgi:S-formylglutathione hydrolase